MQGRKEKFSSSKDFCLFYGMRNEDKLCKFNTAIVETEGYNKDSIKYLHDKGTFVIAYLSLMEINESSKNFNLLLEEDFLHVNGRRVVNESYGNYLIDLRSNTWTALVMYSIGKLFMNQSFDGIFIDTAGDIEDFKLAGEIKSFMIPAAAGLIAKIKTRFPDHIIIQNNGLREIVNYTSDYIDGICLENPPYEFLHKAAEKIRYLKGRGIKILVLTDNQNNECMRLKKWTEREGAQLYMAHRGYMNIE